MEVATIMAGKLHLDFVFERGLCPQTPAPAASFHCLTWPTNHLLRETFNHLLRGTLNCLF